MRDPIPVDGGKTETKPEPAPNEALDAWAILGTLGGIILVSDAAGSIRWTNKAGKNLVKSHCRPHELPQLTDLTIDDDRAFLAHYLDELRQGRKVRGVLRLIPFKSTDATPPLRARLRSTMESKTPFLVLHSAALDKGKASRLPTPADEPHGAERRCVGQWRRAFTGDGEITWSAELSQFLGRPDDPTVPLRDFLISRIHPDDRDQVLRAFERAETNHEPVFTRHRTLTRSGEYRHLELHGSIEVASDGSPLGLTGLVYDITDEVKANRSLALREAQFTRIMAEINDVVSVADAAGIPTYVSPSAERVYGYKPEALLGQSFVDILHPEDRASVISQMASLMDDPKPLTATYRVVHKNGSDVWIEGSIYCELNPDTGRFEFTTVSRDVTERKHAEEELLAARERAEAASMTKSRFLANMSHELRTPLNAIIGFSDIIQRELFGPIGTARYREYAQLIQESGGHLLDLINDILDMSKIEAGKYEVNFEQVEIEDIVRASIRLLQRNAQEAGIILHAASDTLSHMVRADRRVIKQILLNLLSNALKFTPKGGRVTVSVIGFSDGASIQVADTGIGIAEENLQRVMAPFEQVSGDALLSQGGTGLGLSLVQSLVQLHNGTLAIDSVLGEGTVVTVFLPENPVQRRVA